MSVHLKIFHRTKWHEHHIKANRLEQLKGVAENSNDSNPYTLIKSLLDDYPTQKTKLPRRTFIRQSAMNAAKVLARIVFVVVIFYAAALTFAHLEDENVHHSTTTNETGEEKNASTLWSYIQIEYNVELTRNDMVLIHQKIEKQIEQIKVFKIEQAAKHNNDLSHLKIQKWF